jgi:hypothetical protein
MSQFRLDEPGKEMSMKLGRWVLAGAMLVLPVKLLAHEPPNPEEFEAQEATLFAQADANGDGVLSLDEFKTFQKLMRENMMAHHFQALDTNGDSGVSLEELEAHGPGPGPRHGGPWHP